MKEENFVGKSVGDGKNMGVKNEYIGGDDSTGTIFSSRGILFVPRARGLDRQLRHAQKIIRRAHPPTGQLRSVDSSIPRFPKSTHCLGPAEDLFDSLSYPLTDCVALVARGAAVNSRTALALGVGGDMGNDLATTQEINKAAGVVVLVRSQRFDSHALSPLTFDHL